MTEWIEFSFAAKLFLNFYSVVCKEVYHSHNLTIILNSFVCPVTPPIRLDPKGSNVQGLMGATLGML